MRVCHQLMAIILSHLLLNLTYAEEVHVAVAANFTATMKEIAARFEQKTQHQVILTSGSSGKIAAQIQHGAPFHVFLSADQAKPEALEKAGLTVPNSRFTYALGALVLWSAKPDWIEGDDARLQTGDFAKLALANPKLAPYGSAAVDVLEALQLTSATQAKWVMGENIAQTYQFVATGNAQLGFVALSQVMENGKLTHGSGWMIPTHLHQPIRQDAVLLKSAADNSAAKALLTYLQSDEARAIIHSYGYHFD